MHKILRRKRYKHFNELLAIRIILGFKGCMNEQMINLAIHFHYEKDRHETWKAVHLQHYVRHNIKNCGQVKYKILLRYERQNFYVSKR